MRRLSLTGDVGYKNATLQSYELSVVAIRNTGPVVGQSYGQKTDLVMHDQLDTR